MSEGWVKLHRKVKSHWLYTKPRVFSEFEAWLDLIMSVNHSDNTFMLGMTLMDVKKGSMVTSIKQLCARWGWSNTKVSNFLALLEKEEMILWKNDAKKTLLTVVNYRVYQDGDGAKNDDETSEKRYHNDDEAMLKHTNNNVKECIKNEKKNFGEFVTMTNAEYGKLTGTYGEDKARRMIDILDNYKGSTGKKYKSDYRAILNWVVGRTLKEDQSVVTMANAGAYKDEDDKCPLCRDTGWVLNDSREMVRCSCQEVEYIG